MKKLSKYHFSGWATKANMICTDGLTIMKDAFKHHDGQTVPLVWNHQHNDPTNILGHALLSSRDGSIYAYCEFNNTPAGQDAKVLVEHGDVTHLSIWANQVRKDGFNVVHGMIKEVSLVVAGANPGARIEEVVSHSDGLLEGIIFTDEEIKIHHSDDVDDESDDESDQIEHGDSDESETINDVFDTLTEKQKTVVYAMLAQVMEESMKQSDDLETPEDKVNHSDKPENPEGGQEDMKHNIFEKKVDDKVENVTLSHAEQMEIINDAKRIGSMKESVLQHGITNIDYLFPDAQKVTDVPGFIQREMGWVGKVMSSVHKTPFSRIKSVFADITEADARAKGYLKGNRKTDEVFSLLKRTTSPTTIYKKQKLERDDVIDITDFDVVAWLKAEMRMMLDEEIARAILVGDGRLASSDDKIKEDCIRPIWKDDSLYTIKAAVEVSATESDTEVAKAFIRSAIKSRKNYKGSGEPTLFIAEDFLTDCLLIEDNTGRIIYDSVTKLATTLRVKEIVPVTVMENLTRVDGANTLTLMGIIVNLNDYNAGADKGGAVNMFDDFDIDYNAQKYLIETRCSGALIKPFAAIALEKKIVA